MNQTVRDRTLMSLNKSFKRWRPRRKAHAQQNALVRIRQSSWDI